MLGYGKESPAQKCWHVSGTAKATLTAGDGEAQGVIGDCKGKMGKMMADDTGHSVTL